MNQNHNENKGVHSKSLIYCTGIGYCPSTDHTYIKATHHEWNNSKQVKSSLSYFQGLLFVFEVGEDFL